MPEPSTLAPYDILDEVLNLVRTRLNDAIQTIGGETFTDEAVWSQTAANGGWRKFQEFMASNGAPRLVTEQIISGLQVAQGGNPPDPGLQASISWVGYNDGLFEFDGPSLPFDMICPIRLWERISGATPPNQFTQMEPITQGTTSVIQGPRNYYWEWRNDAIYIPGSTNVMDIKLRYAQYLPDFRDIGEVRWFNQQVPIMRAKEALAWFIASEVSSARGDTDSTVFDTKAEAEAMKLVQREKSLMAQRQQWVIPDLPGATDTSNQDRVSFVLNMARVRLNAVNKLAGDFLSSSQDWTQQATISGWRKLQEVLSGLQFSAMSTEGVINSVPPNPSTDPADYVSLGWDGYRIHQSGGDVFSPTPALPQNLVRPMRLWERVNGSNAVWTPMESDVTGIGSQPKGSRNYAWQWLGNQVRMPGSLVAMDIRIEYSMSFDDFAQTGSTPWYLQEVPVSRSADSLAWYLCAEVAASVQGNADIDPNGLLTPDSFAAKGEAAAKLLVSRDQQGLQSRGEWTVPDIPAATGATSLDYVGTIMNAARVRLNKVSTMAGDAISVGKPFTQQYFTSGWRRLQESLSAKDFSALKAEMVIQTSPSGNPTIGSSVWVGWDGYYNGATFNAFTVLPQDLIRPVRMWERILGSGAAFDPMEMSQTGIGNQPVGNRNMFWQWRQNRIYMPGSTATMELRLEYARSLPDMVSNATTPWYLQQVPISRCLNALAWYICAEVAMARPDLEIDADEMNANAEAATIELAKSDAQAASGRGEWIVPQNSSIPSSSGATHYDIAATIMNAAMVRLNRVSAVAGDIISPDKAFTQKYFSMGYRRLQEFLTNMGYLRVNDQVIIPNIPPVVTSDPASQCYLTWSGYFNGSALNTAITLPADLMRPLEVWERWSGQDARFGMMTNAIDGIRDQNKCSANIQWEWRADALYFPGSQMMEDLKLRYSKFLPDLQSDSTPWYLKEVPIVRCQDSLSLFICAEVARSRPDLGLDYEALTAEAEGKAKLIYNLDVKANQRVNLRRIPRSGRGSGNRMGWGLYN